MVTFNGKFKASSVPKKKQIQRFKQKLAIATHFAENDFGDVFYRIFDSTDLENDVETNDSLTSILNAAGFPDMDRFFLLVVTWDNVEPHNYQHRVLVGIVLNTYQ